MAIEAWVKDVCQFFNLTPPKDMPVSKEFLEVFKENLSLLSALSITKKDCAEGCVESVMGALQPAHFDLSEVGQNEILSYVEQFKTAAASTSHLYEEEQLPAILAFKEALGQAIEDKWTESMARSFYPIPKISDENERAKAACAWTHNFFRGAQFLNRCETDSIFVSGHFVGRLVNKTMLAFHVHAHDEIQNRMSTILRLHDKDPIEFAKRIQEVEVKVEDEPGTVIVDKQFEQLFEDAAPAVTGYWPEVEESKTHLRKCIWMGYTLHSMEFPIADHPLSSGLFKNVFKKDPQ